MRQQYYNTSQTTVQCSPLLNQSEMMVLERHQHTDIRHTFWDGISTFVSMKPPDTLNEMSRYFQDTFAPTKPDIFLRFPNAKHDYFPKPNQVGFVPCSVSSSHFRSTDLLGAGTEGGRKKKRGEEKEESEIEKRMSYEMSLVWLLLSSSVQWSLPPWESAVWTKTTDGGGRRSSCRRSSSHLCRLPLINGRRKRRRWKNGWSGAEKKKGEEKCEDEEREGVKREQVHTYTGCQQITGGGGQGRRKVKLKSHNRAAGRQNIQEGRWERKGGGRIARKKITLGDGSIVFERITPTQAFSNQQEEELNVRSGGWGGGGGGGDEIERGEKRQSRKNCPQCFFVFSWIFLAITDAGSLWVSRLLMTVWAQDGRNTDYTKTLWFELQQVGEV